MGRRTYEEKMHVKATIVMPRTTPGVKVNAVRRLGGKAVLHGEDVDHELIRANDQMREITDAVNGVYKATLNRTAKSFAFAIVGAEYLLRWLPRGTHDWRKFVTPTELSEWVGDKFDLQHQVGMKLNPFTSTWHTTSSLDVNYIQAFAHRNKG